MTTHLTEPCPACQAGLTSECWYPTDIGDGWIKPCITFFERIEATDKKKPAGEGTFKDPTEIGDALSTGRKRAAMLAPIMSGMTCEWAGLKWAGGGIRPIVGCRGTKLFPVKKNADLPTDVPGPISRGELQHGPDKAVLNNAVGVNLHRICASCHHRWHELNDPGYSGTRPDAHIQWLPSQPYYPHDSDTNASEEELTLSENWWATPKKDRPPYPIELPPENRLRVPANDGILTEDDNPFEDPIILD